MHELIMAKATESLEEFYRQEFNDLSENLKKDTRQFNVCAMKAYYFKCPLKKSIVRFQASSAAVLS
jgi:hypothetical protein